MVSGCKKTVPDNSAIKQETEQKTEQETEQERDYVMHHDYYYRTYPTDKVFLSTCEDEYVIGFKTEYKDEVLEYLENVGFTHLQSTADMANSYLKEFQPDIEYPDYLLGYTLAWIKGNGEIDKIPRVFFSDNLYICNDMPEDKFYTTLVFDIQWNDNKQLLNKALEYAEEFKIFPDVIGPSGYVRFMCINESKGTAIELANWFCEAGGFSYAQPAYLKESSGWD